MSFTLTAIILAVAVAIAAVAGWRDAQPPSHNPRLVPWRIVFFLSGAVAMFMLLHLVNLAGFVTGRNQAAP